jgi:hypothetical protein
MRKIAGFALFLLQDRQNMIAGQTEDILDAFELERFAD